MTKILLVALALIVPTCLISLMAVFMGGGQSGEDLSSLLFLQLVTIPVATLILVACVLRYTGTHGLAQGMARLWHDLPQWLVFVFVLLGSLSLIGELAFFILRGSFGGSSTWHEHVPLVCLLLSSLAFCALYALTRSTPGVQQHHSGRWP